MSCQQCVKYVLSTDTLGGCTAAHGAKFELRWTQPSYPATINDPDMAAWSGSVLKRILGNGKVSVVPPVMPGEDFSFFQRQIPGFFYNLCAGNPSRDITAANHTAEFDVDEDSLPIGVKTGAALLLDALAKYR